MPVQVKINPNTGLTLCGNSIEKELNTQCLFSSVYRNGVHGWGFGIPNVLRSAWQLLGQRFDKKNVAKDKECIFHPHAYWSVDNRPVGTKQIVDSGVFSFLYGEKKNSSLKEIEEYSEHYIDFVNNHFGKYCKTNNTPWFVELDIYGKYPVEDYRRLQRKLMDSCPNRDFIGVFHCGEGLKMIDELAEKFDYLSIGGNAIAKDRTMAYQAIQYIRKKYPEKCVHLLGADGIQNNFVWGDMHHFVDTCDSTGYSSSARTGCNGQRRYLVAPALHWVNDNWLKWFPVPFPENEEKRKTRDSLTGITERGLEAYIWVICKVQCIWSYFNLYGPQKQWNKGAMRNVVKKILSGDGNKLNESDIGEFLYNFEEGELCGNKIYFPEGYKDIFEKQKIDFVQNLI